MMDSTVFGKELLLLLERQGSSVRDFPCGFPSGRPLRPDRLFTGLVSVIPPEALDRIAHLLPCGGFLLPPPPIDSIPLRFLKEQREPLSGHSGEVEALPMIFLRHLFLREVISDEVIA